MKQKIFLLPACIAVLLTACWRDDSLLPSGPQMAYVPYYLSEKNVDKISIDAPKETTDPGKIYASGSFIFQNDINSGIHIIDVSDRSHPQKTAFLNVPLCKELAVKGKYLYTNNYTDMLVFDISDPAKPVLAARVKNTFKSTDQKYPPYNNVYFECPDESKGVVVGWVLKQIESPKCRR